MSSSEKAMVRSQKGGMVEKRVGPQERGGKSAGRSDETERKAQSGVWIRGHFGSSSQALLAFLQFFILHPSCVPATAVAIRAAQVAVLGR